MSQYYYSPLSLGHDSIRLLRLMPHEDETADIQCELFEYSLRNSSKGTHLYDALSYVWGNSDEKLPIFIHKHKFDVTVNLHAALSRLRNHSLERILWVDAICIHQENQEEKEHQIQSMAKVYGQANRVIVWLGKAENDDDDDSDQALESIRTAAGKGSMDFLDSNTMQQQGILALLQRPWFRRIWVLQEIAAARNLLIMSGSTEIDGHAFCSGLEVLKGFYETRTDLQGPIRSVTFLMRGASFRPKYANSGPGMDSLSICPLSVLIDMFHMHKATMLHDKIYALLGMNSDDLGAAGLSPDYGLPWEELLKRLVKFLLGEQISIKTWANREIVVVDSKGRVLGQVRSVKIVQDNRQKVGIVFTDKTERPARKKYHAHWTLATSAKSVQEGDIVCLLHGASKPTIVRPCKDYFSVIMMAISPEEELTKSGGTKWSDLLLSVFPHDFLLVWDWKNSAETLQDLEEYGTVIQTNRWVSEYSKTESEGYLDKAIRTWRVALVLEDLDEYEKAKARIQEATEGYKMVFGEQHPDVLGSQSGQTPLSWAAGNGYDVPLQLLFTKYAVDYDLKDSQNGLTPLSWAAYGGHEAIVKLLLETGKVNIESKDNDGRTPLLLAAYRGHEAVVKLLLETGKVDLELKDNNGQTPLSLAAERGHEAVVKLLLETGKVGIESKDNNRQTPLSLAASKGHEAVVKLLLETGKVNINLEDNNRWTPLLLGVYGGHEAVVKLLLKAGKVDINLEDNNGWAPLSLAAYRGHEAVVKLLLETGKVDLELKDNNGQTPLSLAAEKGHEAVVKLLLKTGKVDLELKDNNGRTPLSWAVFGGHEAVVKLLQQP